MKTIPFTLLISLILPFSSLMTLGQDLSQNENKAVKAGSSSWRASQVIGANVKNAGDETIGEIEDLFVDLKNGKILGAVISSGGFLGIADTLSIVPLSSISYDSNSKAFKTTLTKQQLQEAPRFDKSAWPDSEDFKITEKLQTFSNSIGVHADGPENSSKNKRELKDDELDPTDQGNSDADIEITRKIRSGIMEADLSFNSKNIKIITKDGHVTLKGVVKNHDEHQRVLSIANTHADKSKVIDKLTMEEN